MKRLKLLFFWTILAIFLGACANTKAPITGREQYIGITPQQEIALGLQAEKQILSKVKLSTNKKYNAAVTEVGRRIASVTGISGYQWEFFVVDAPNTANAFCLPGGKVFVYSGILKYTSNKNELAAVMGHEIGHALARHGAERLSQSQLANFGGQILKVVMATQGVSSGSSNAVLQAYGMASQYGVILPYSRTQEYEADKIGLVLMAKAGYDPSATVVFWNKFIKSNNGRKVPEYASTHPDPTNRIAQIQAIIPEVMPLYKQSRR